MSMWIDETSGDGLTDQLPATGDDQSHPDDDLLVPTGAGEEWTPDQGYPDSSLSVRIWVDDDRRLTKVRISNRWRDRARGTSLSSMDPKYTTPSGVGSVGTDGPITDRGEDAGVSVDDAAPSTGGYA